MHGSPGWESYRDRGRALNPCWATPPFQLPPQEQAKEGGRQGPLPVEMLQAGLDLCRDGGWQGLGGMGAGGPPGRVEAVLSSPPGILQGARQEHSNNTHTHTPAKGYISAPFC